MVKYIDQKMACNEKGIITLLMWMLEEKICYEIAAVDIK